MSATSAMPTTKQATTLRASTILLAAGATLPTRELSQPAPADVASHTPAARPVKRGGKGTEVIRLGHLTHCEVPVVVYQPGGDDAEVGDHLDDGEEGLL